MTSSTLSGPTTRASRIESNWLSCGLRKAGSVMRRTLKTTSSGVSGVPSWNLMSERIVNSISVGDL